jgi:hypothetical protein
MPALLTDRGLSADRGAMGLSVMGGAGVAGRLITGWLIDRFFAARVSFALRAGEASEDHIICGELDLRESSRPQRSAAPHRFVFQITIARRIAIHVDVTGVEIDDPDLWHSGRCIQRNLLGAIDLDRRVGDFDEEEHIGRARVRIAIEVGARLDDRHIRLRFGVIVQLHGMLNSQLKRFANVRCKQMGQQCHAPGMAASDWRQVNDLAGQQFDAVIFAEDRSLGHLVKLVDRKQSSRRLNGH